MSIIFATFAALFGCTYPNRVQRYNKKRTYAKKNAPKSVFL